MRKDPAGRPILAIGLALFLGLSACQGGSKTARDQSAAATAATDTAAVGRAGGAPAATPKGGLTDSNIVAILDEANKADSAGGALALKKATRPDVKAFAKLMMGEHHALRVEGEQLAKQLNIAPKPPEHDPLAGYIRNEAATLQKTPKGPGFDRTYIDNEVSVHQAVLDFANQARVTTPTPELRALIEKAIPVIRKHLQQAEGIQKQLTPAA
jgi:putative membrane protein